MFMSKNFYTGAKILSKEKEEELLFFGSGDAPEDIKITVDKYREYNQSAQRRTRNACVLYASLGCLSDLFAYNFSKEEILEVVNLAEKHYGWKEDSGMYLHKGAACVVKWWNDKFPERPVTSFRTTLGSEEYGRRLKQGVSGLVGYKTNSKYYKDKEDDGVVNEDYTSLGKLKYWHAIRHTYEYKLIDNYKGKRNFNTYTNEQILNLKEKGVFFPSFFYFLPSDTYLRKRETAVKVYNLKKKLRHLQRRWIMEEMERNGVDSALVLATYMVETTVNKNHEINIKRKNGKLIIC